MVSFDYQSDIITLQEEYLIFDKMAILATIGGSLGLFIGFSFFHCGSLILEGIFSVPKYIMNTKVKVLDDVEHL